MEVYITVQACNSVDFIVILIYVTKMNRKQQQKIAVR